MDDRNTQSLLTWAVEHSNPVDPANPPAPPTVDRRWMNILLSNPSQQVAQQLKAYRETSDGAAKVAALETVLEMVESIDVANDLAKQSGSLDTVIDALRFSDASIRSLAADILGVCSQNNPNFQESVPSGRVLPTLLALFSDRAEDGEVQKKALFALSSLLRYDLCQLPDSPNGVLRRSPTQCQAFAELDGWNSLLSLVQAPSAVFRRKLLFSLRNMAMEVPALGDMVARNRPAVEALLAQLALDDVDLLDTSLDLFAVLRSRSSNTAALAALLKELGFAQQLAATVKRLQKLADEAYDDAIRKAEAQLAAFAQ
jgi:hypothetical protein